MRLVVDNDQNFKKPTRHTHSECAQCNEMAHANERMRIMLQSLTVAISRLQRDNSGGVA